MKGEPINIFIIVLYPLTTERTEEVTEIFYRTMEKAQCKSQENKLKSSWQT